MRDTYRRSTTWMDGEGGEDPDIDWILRIREDSQSSSGSSSQSATKTHKNASKTNPTPHSSTTSPKSSATNKPKTPSKGLSGGGIAGIVFASIIVAIIISSIIFYFIRKRKRRILEMARLARENETSQADRRNLFAPNTPRGSLEENANAGTRQPEVQLVNGGLGFDTRGIPNVETGNENGGFHETQSQGESPFGYHAESPFANGYQAHYEESVHDAETHYPNPHGEA